jgi:hypothetical protein
MKLNLILINISSKNPLRKYPNIVNLIHFKLKIIN